MYDGMEAKLHVFSNSGLVGDEWAASCTSYLNPRESIASN
jgi:hypothetical protein